ncbi:MAG TPA: GIY-YIG nuclease family protein [Candidatus Saccharibacteria bacterium]|nr:GIY-YIG nuclease family protein [Candidatus Saccharibacteria bacterium]
MFYVYILKSLKDGSIYTGYMKDLKRRFKEHNNGKSHHTSKHMPWLLHAYFALNNETDALKFESYLKTGSGIAFSRKHFL